MYKGVDKRRARRRRHQRIRKHLNGTSGRPRLCVFRSLKHIYAQVIDDQIGRTVAAASTLDAALRDGKASKVERARAVGKAIGERARGVGVRQVVFDRAGYRYHGRVRQLAEGAREAGLEF